MNPREFPTKGNLMLAKNSLMLARQGYDLMDKKRNILLKELMGLIDEAKDIQEEIDATFTKAYACLQRANIEHGISKVHGTGIYRSDRGLAEDADQKHHGNRRSRTSSTMRSRMI